MLAFYLQVPSAYNLNKSTTCARLRQGNYAVVVAHSKKLLKTSHLPMCPLTKIPEKFYPPLGPPRFLSLLESSCPVFTGISFDLVGPLRFQLKHVARGVKL